MPKHLRRLVWAEVLAFVLAASSGATPQGNPDPFAFKFMTGQNIQPIFEGWAHNSDGSYSMWFGYMNRNYVEQLHVPPGADNKFEPGAPDRGQPTFFYPRIHRKAFSVKVPGDWDKKKELVWTVTVRGKTESAIAWLQPEWEIDPIYDGKTRSAESLKNKPPTLTVDSASMVTIPNTLTLTALVTDDGLPKPRKGGPKQAVGQETPPTLKPLPDQPEIPVNVPQTQTDSSRRRDTVEGLVLTWIVWRGPAAATFDPAGRITVKDSRVVVTAKFTTPGLYVLRARAFDGELWDEKDLNVTVSGPTPSHQQP